MKTRLCYAGIALFAGLIAFDGPSETVTHNPVESTVAMPAPSVAHTNRQFTINYVAQNTTTEPRQGNHLYDVQMVNNGPDIWGGEISLRHKNKDSFSYQVAQIPQGQTFTVVFEVNSDTIWYNGVDGYSIVVDQMTYAENLDQYQPHVIIDNGDDLDYAVEDMAYELAEEIVSGRR